MADIEKVDVGGTVYNIRDANTYSKAETDALLKSKVDTVSGKGLSSNDYTTAEKNKLAGIATGAQVNTITGVKGNAESSYRTGNVNLTPANIGAASTNTATTSANGLMSSTDKSKLDGIRIGHYYTDLRQLNLSSPTIAKVFETMQQGDIAIFNGAQLAQESKPAGSNTMTIYINKICGKNRPIIEAYNSYSSQVFYMPVNTSGVPFGTWYRYITSEDGIVPISNGGTGATTAAAAIAALGAGCGIGTTAASVSNITTTTLANGFYFQYNDSGKSNSPDGKIGWIYLHAAYNSSNVIQLAFKYGASSSSSIYYRNCYSGTWNAWALLK